MLSIPKRFQLVGGPYRAPRVPKSGCLRCAMRGWTPVDGYTDAPISWPAKWGRSPLLCGDLIRAVRREAKPVVAYHWGVSIITVYKWRKVLGVKEWNEGSSKLLRYARMAGEAGRGSSNAMVMAANPRRRSARFRRLMKKRALARIKRTGSLDVKRRRPWTAEENKLLGRLTDDEAAARTGRTRRAVLTRRRRLGVKCPTCSWAHWTADQTQLLGTMPDRELAQRLGHTTPSIAIKRRRLRIPAFRRGEQQTN
ncbi:MAG: hypothetical protein C5B50_07055 [Verrucomicrobia bacterium]|nr:MAG: hypothetical protein C5B50_07055 [Verrucomicrobiota bacterium]